MPPLPCRSSWENGPEQARPVQVGDLRPAIPHGKAQHRLAIQAGEPDPDGGRARFGEFGGVVHQVHQGLTQAAGIGHQALGDAWRDMDCKLDAALLRLVAEQVDDALQQRP